MPISVECPPSGGLPTRMLWDGTKSNGAGSMSGYVPMKVNVLPYAEIPVNREVKYDVPRPAVPLEKLELLPEFRK